MRNSLLTILLVLTNAASVLGAKKHTFQSGKLINITTDERLFQGTTIRRAIFTVQIGDLIYTARGGRERPRSGDPGHGLVIGDPVQVAIDGEKLILLEPGGKELKTRIIKRARAE